jgi:hypothetical protein
MTIPTNTGMSSGGTGAQASSSAAQPQNRAPRASTSTRKMPKPGEKNAPVFDPEKPEELGRFFERMEDWFLDEDIEEDVDKKRRIVRYLDADSESQWKALATFADGTFENFKTEVMASYPKAEEVMKGSVSALRKKAKNLGPVEVENRDELLALVRVMNAEVVKLKKISPPIHTNRELVELFLGRLSPDFAARVANKLSVHRLFTVNNPVDNAVARNTEDMYDIEEVMEMAKHTSLEHANPFGKFLHGIPDQSSRGHVKLEEVVARLEDSINVQIQHNKRVDQSLNSMQNFMSQPKIPAAQSGYSRGLTPAPVHTIICFYCKGQHRIAECADALLHMDLNWIKRIDGYLRLPDGQHIPRDGSKSMKEIIEALNKGKPGIIPMSKIQDKASLYQESAKLSSFVQQEEEEDMRALTELIQRIGFDRMQQMWGAPEQVTRQEQNFD